MLRFTQLLAVGVLLAAARLSLGAEGDLTMLP